MKKLLLLLPLISMTLLSFGQDKVGVYYTNNSKLIQLSTSRITGSKVGNIAGAYFTLGLSAANNNKIVEGKESETVINDKSPVFKIVFGESRNIGYALSSIDNIDNIVLVKLHKKGKSRNLRTGKYGLIAGVQSGLNDDDIIPISIDDIDDVTQLVTPKEELKKGEYCFYYAGETPKGEKEFNSVFDFSVK